MSVVLIEVKIRGHDAECPDREEKRRYFSEKRLHEGTLAAHHCSLKPEFSETKNPRRLGEGFLSVRISTVLTATSPMQPSLRAR